jgi:hypothetical protein
MISPVDLILSCLTRSAIARNTPRGFLTEDAFPVCATGTGPKVYPFGGGSLRASWADSGIRRRNKSPKNLGKIGSTGGDSQARLSSSSALFASVSFF